jgi:hypothetical protein
MATDPVISRVAVAALVAPIVFIALNLLGIALISKEHADLVVEYLSSVWPALKVQYEYVYNSGLQLNAVNYAFFAGYLTILAAIAVAATIVFYLRTLPQPKAIVGGDWFVLCVFGSGVYFALYKDLPDSIVGSLAFRANAVSLFLRQWVMMLGVSVCLIITAATIMTFISYIGFAILGRRDNGIPL